MRARSSNVVVIGSLAIALSLGLASGAIAGDFERGAPLEERLDRLAGELGLDDATRARIEAIAEESRPRTQALRDRVRRERNQLRELLATSQPDLQDVLALAELITVAEGEMLKERLRRTLEIRSLLSPEQREALVAETSDRRDAHEQRRAERHAAIERACSAEIAASCPSGANGAFGLRRCLMNAENVSPACTEEIQRERPGRAGRRHRGPGTPPETAP
jgi:Spy/CpxP family protein refolding chaperone